ncbi:TPA: hypothetical protein I8V59_001609 [Corynebacterium striatum]|nr:hypothetical protein [Corynebacterium striatum]
MTIEQIQAQIQALTDDEYIDLRVWMGSEERSRREAQPAIEQAQAEVVKELQDAGKLPLPDALTDAEKLPEAASDVPEWRDPGTDHSMMYREGDIVRYQGRIVRSTHKGLNSWEPGVLNYDGRIWEDITPVAAEEDPETGETITQWAPGIAATVGMKLTYNGSTYEVIQAHTTAAHWLPDALPALYKRLG